MHSVRNDRTNALTGISRRLGKADWERGELSNAAISSRLIGCFVQDFGFAFFSLFLFYSCCKHTTSELGISRRAKSCM